MIKAGIVGATGYTGIELIRLLALHPMVEIAAVTSRANDGQKVSKIFPSLRDDQTANLTFQSPHKSALSDCDLVFFATPNGVAMKEAPKLLDAGAKVVDLSADYRIQDIATWEDWYGMSHASPELVKSAVYGLPEMNRSEIQSANLVANPGCYPTAVQLGFLPLLKSDLIEPKSLIADAKSGVSGAGRKESLLTSYCEVNESFKAYAAAGHRHLPEIKQGLQGLTAEPLALTFVPHLVPMLRGIESTLYAITKGELGDVQKLYEDTYQNEPFVDVLPQGILPETRSVKGSNQCRISVIKPRESEHIVISSVIDNLVKGAAGQAIQNMNLMFGFEETTGLEGLALLP